MARIEETLRRRDRLANRMREVYSRAVYSRRSHADLLDDRSRRVLQTADWKLSPRWVRAFAEGIESECRKRIHWNLLEWVLIGPDGRMFRKDDHKWLEGSSVYKSSMFGFHVWKASLDENEFAIYS